MITNRMILLHDFVTALVGALLVIWVFPLMSLREAGGAYVGSLVVIWSVRFFRR